MTNTVQLPCPECGEELQVQVDSAPQTQHYPGHREIVILERSCNCTLDMGDLYVDAAEDANDDCDAAYDAMVDRELAGEGR